ncbi:MAG: ATP-dependent DNA helicase RecG [Eubacteriales bacterium]|nr:ATP-dependent DNA helicase RecG [Eubacteriales bacterium]
MKPEASVRTIRGLGPKAAEALAGRGIRTVGDLLEYYPSGYEYFAPEEEAGRVEPGSSCALRMTVLGNGSVIRRGARVLSHFEAGDRTARVRLTFYNMPYLRGVLQPGDVFVFRGILRQTKTGGLYMEQPRFIPAADYDALRGTLQPDYPLPKGISAGRMRAFLQAALEAVEAEPDSLPEAYRARYGLTDRASAIREIHFPSGRESLLQARKRLVFDEFFTFILGVRRQKEAEGIRANRRPMRREPAAGGGDWCARFLECLPFSLTGEQARAWEEIQADLAGPVLMNRLLQGDVGSGKTVLAFLALVLCAMNGRQGALMAPTEVLARQHMESFRQYMENSGLPVRAVLLTGSVKGKARREALQAIAENSASVVIGTHALFQEKVSFGDLGLVITDEQHRFGVRQRTGLLEKGEDVPVLVMSATPIPRTLAIILYGELQVSALRALPPGRKPVKSLAMQDTQRGRAYRFILSEIRKGRQCYVICPAVEEGALRELENVADYTEKLRSSLPGNLRIASLNGRMRPEEKNRIMEEFSAGGTDILVSTTVIEVGINVPNATLILIENAGRFGLSQLHQLRGRVGRGQEQSYCIFLYTGREKPERLEVLEKTSDGFSIAEQDLKARGPGDLFGTRQSGLPQFVLADLYEDAQILRDAAACADEILREHPDFRIRGGKSVDFSTI